MPPSTSITVPTFTESASIPSFGVDNVVAEFQRQTDVTQIDQVKAHHQQVIDRVSQGLIAVKNVHQKDAAVFVQRVRDPDGQARW